MTDSKERMLTNMDLDLAAVNRSQKPTNRRHIIQAYLKLSVVDVYCIHSPMHQPACSRTADPIYNTIDLYIRYSYLPKLHGQSSPITSRTSQLVKGVQSSSLSSVQAAYAGAIVVVQSAKCRRHTSIIERRCQRPHAGACAYNNDYFHRMSDGGPV